MRCFSALAIVALLSAGCGGDLLPPGPVAGSWMHADALPSGSYAQLVLSQTGATVRGTYFRHGAVTGTVISQAGVSGSFVQDTLRLAISTTSGGPSTFVGVLVSPDTLTGQWTDAAGASAWGATRQQ